MPRSASALRSLPSVDRLLRHPETEVLLASHSRQLVTGTLRRLLADVRAGAAPDDTARIPDADEIVRRLGDALRGSEATSLRPVVNASGVVLHTNLGRATLAAEAVEAVRRVADEPCNLEYDLGSGTRGERDLHVEPLLAELAGAEAALVVNNNAAAVLLALNTLAERREVVVSRGELVEIGGSFRIPEILAKSGAVLREVGTTNRTHARDYEQAIGPGTALLLKIHPSNYRVTGFTAEVSLGDLVEIGGRHGLPVMEDLGSGALVDLSRFGLPREPVVAERIALGAAVVTFSGDKLLGGPQAGLAVGRRETIERMRANPLRRALRADKLTLAALEATLRLYRGAPDLGAALPTLRMLTRPLAEMEEVGRAAAALLATALGPDFDIQLADAASEIGSGALATETLPTRALVIRHARLGPDAVAARFRAADPPIVGRVHDDRFWLDLRCIRNAEDLVPRVAADG